MNFSLPHPWFFLAGAALLVLWAGSLLAVRLWTRHQVLKALREQVEGPEEVGITLPDSGPRDQAALELIRSYRRRYLLKLWPGTAISFKAINEMSQELIREIARVYHPDEARPELKASLADLVALHNRVGSRLAPSSSAAWRCCAPGKAITIFWRPCRSLFKEEPGPFSSWWWRALTGQRSKRRSSNWGCSTGCTWWASGTR